MAVHRFVKVGLVALAWAGFSNGVAFAEPARGASAPTHEIAQGKGQATLLLNAGTGSPEAALSRLILNRGAQVPEHVHDQSAELLYVISGPLIVQLDGQSLTLQAGDAVRIPAGHKHAGSLPPGVGKAELVQVYVGPGPEQRFTQGKRLPPPPTKP